MIRVAFATSDIVSARTAMMFTRALTEHYIGNSEFPRESIRLVGYLSDQTQPPQPPRAHVPLPNKIATTEVIEFHIVITLRGYNIASTLTSTTRYNGINATMARSIQRVSLAEFSILGNGERRPHQRSRGQNVPRSQQSLSTSSYITWCYSSRNPDVYRGVT